MILFGKCKVCAEKDKRIHDLLAQVETLRALATPPTSASRIPVLQMEADSILSGRDQPLEVNKEQIAERERIDSEAHRILSGTY